MDYILVYVTVDNKEEARKIGLELLNKRLVACVNILDSVTSLFRWQNELEEAAEVILLAKTRQELFSEVKTTVEALHSYDIPCIVALPIKDGHTPYLNWIKAETT